MQNNFSKLIINHALPPNDTYPDEHRTTNSALQLINKLKIPYFRKILKLNPQCFKKIQSPDALNTPTEEATARAMGWDSVEGELPFAALKAAELGLHAPSEMTQGSWAFITLCSWHVQHGQVTFRGDANAVGLTQTESDHVLHDMKAYFQEDSVHLISHPKLKPGQWLAYSEHFNGLASASLARVSGRVIDDFLIGTGKSKGHKSERTLRRLQNEMQMLLHQHSINDQKSMPINSFWISGTGQFKAAQDSKQTILENYQRIQSFDVWTSKMELVHSDEQKWAEIWSREWESLDESVIKIYLDYFLNLSPDAEISLCNDTTCITLTPFKSQWVSGFKNLFKSSKITRQLGL